LSDGAYDSWRVCLEAKGIELVVKPRRNSRPDTASPERMKMAREFRYPGFEAWTGGALFFSTN